jgi:DNA-binding transcriptional LysR family regulator
MELRQLEYLVAVAEEGSFTRAGERVHVAQSGVSAQIRRLERELGHELLDRSGRTVTLTAVGRSVVPYARSALAAVSGARVAVDELAGLVRGEAAVGMVTACASLDLTDLLARFHRLHPGVEINLSEANSVELVAGLRDGSLDLAWVGLAGAPPAGLETQVIVDDALVAAVAHDHPLAVRDSIGLADLGERVLISLPRGTGVRTAFDDGCASIGFEPRVAFEASAPNIVADLASKGLGVAILPESVAEASAGTLKTLRVTRPRMRSRLELAWRADGASSPAARALIGHARTALATVPATTEEDGSDAVRQRAR